MPVLDARPPAETKRSGASVEVPKHPLDKLTVLRDPLNNVDELAVPLARRHRVRSDPPKSLVDAFKVKGLAEQVAFVGAEVGHGRKLYGHGYEVNGRRGWAADSHQADPPATTPEAANEGGRLAEGLPLAVGSETVAVLVPRGRLTRSGVNCLTASTAYAISPGLGHWSVSQSFS